MTVRYTDLDFGDSGVRDFVIRKRIPTIPQLFIIFLSAILIAISVAVSITDKVALISILLILSITLGWYVIIQIQRNRDLLLATEFQNALFASALGLNNKFCLIIKRDGTIIYLDRSFQDMFPDFLRQPRRSIDILLEQGRVSREDSAKIFRAVEQGVYEKVIFDIRGAGNQFYKIVMSIEPIIRPTGFTLLRGREYIESRVEDESPAAAASYGALNKSTITLFSHVMDTMNMGVYMTGPLGNIIYANPILESWLGYKEGEITLKNISLQDLVHTTNPRTESIEPDNYEGEIMLQKKTGGMMKCFINQKIIRNDQGKMMGCTALVHNFISTDADVKKKLW